MRLLVWTRACQSHQVIAWLPAWQYSRILQFLIHHLDILLSPFVASQARSEYSEPHPCFISQIRAQACIQTG